MAVFRDKTVPIPKVTGITINRSDGNRVLFVKEAPYDARAGYARPKRTTIGYVTNHDVKLMHPTSGYKLLFPSEWEKAFGEKVPAVFKHIGLYAISDSVNASTGIKDIMDQCFGADRANAMMDFVLYSMLYQTSVAEHFTTRMDGQQLFSATCHSDSYYSDLFKNKTSYDQILAFRKKWALQCKEDGVQEVWLCIDGSNDDCESIGVTLAEKGHAKSLRNRNIVSFTYAVTEKGKPVTFEIYRGGLVDSKAMRRILSFLKEAGIKVRGVILDRGYCDGTALKFLNSEGMAYIIMVKGSPAGYAKFVDEYGAKIKLNAEYLIRGTNLFGVQDKVQLFDSYKHEDHLTLFYDYKNGGDRLTALLKKLYREMDRCEGILSKGKIPVFCSQFQDVIKVSEDRAKVEIITAELQKLFDEKGLYSIVTSEEMAPQEVHALYQCRNSSETEYMIVKTQLGYGKIRVHVTKSILAKFTIGFIASCVRYELQDVAEEVNRSTNEVIQEMNMLSMTKISDSYVPVQGIAGRQEVILKKLGSSAEILAQIAKDENDRLAGRKPTPRHRKSGPKKSIQSGDKTRIKGSNPAKKASGISAVSQSSTGKERKKPGVKPGTKRTPVTKNGTPRKPPGVPVGFKRGKYNKDGSLRKKPGPKPGVGAS